MTQIGLVYDHSRKKRAQGKGTPKSLAEPNATPRASAITARVNNSREPVLSTRDRSHGKNRTPAISISPMNNMTFPIAIRPPAKDFRRCRRQVST